MEEIINIEVVQKKIKELNNLLQKHDKDYVYSFVEEPKTSLPYSIKATTTNGYIVHDFGFSTITNLYMYIIGYINGLEA